MIKVPANIQSARIAFFINGVPDFNLFVPTMKRKDVDVFVKFYKMHCKINGWKVTEVIKEKKHGRK